MPKKLKLLLIWRVPYEGLFNEGQCRCGHSLEGKKPDEMDKKKDGR